MREKRIEISEETKAILRRAVIEQNTLKIIEKLERKVYLDVNAVLEAAGGKWNKKAKAHLFDGDPAQILGLSVDNGFITKEYVLDTKRSYSQFFTPMQLAAQMVNMAQIEPGMRVLEPSAGKGNLLVHIPREAQIAACELDEELVKKLREEFPHVNTVCGDFLVAYPAAPFDRIVMNPPFDHGADIKHIQHALTMLAEGGRMIAICGNGPRQREILQPLAFDYAELPDGTFSEEGTGVRTALLTFDN